MEGDESLGVLWEKKEQKKGQFAQGWGYSLPLQQLATAMLDSVALVGGTE